MNLKTVTSDSNLWLSEKELEYFDNEINKSEDSSSIDNEKILMNKWMNGWMFYNMFIVHIEQILQHFLPWDCKQNKNCVMSSGISVMGHWPSISWYNVK